jgi:2-methylcitrate dehydratase PrpD
MSATRALAEYVAALSYETLPAAVTERVKALVLDTVGIMVRARNDAESTAPMISAAQALVFTPGECIVVGDPARYTPPGAAMLNGTLALCRKIRTRIHPQAHADFPANMSARVKLETKRGAFETYVRVPKGEPENFLTPAELRAKFDGLVAPYLHSSRRDALASALLGLEQAKDIGAVLSLTVPETARRVAAARG